VAGITTGEHGAYSIAMSGGYEDDVDLGYALFVIAYSVRAPGLICSAVHILALVAVI
jgi:hypothetical protein